MVLGGTKAIHLAAFQHKMAACRKSSALEVSRCQAPEMVTRSPTNMHTYPDLNGVLVVDKPPGPTSHDLVAQARKLFGTRRVGHTGTLDPMATGLLVLLFGEATKLSCVLCSTDKTYHARVVFGHSTDTDDALGNPIDFATSVPTLSSEALSSALDAERARVLQTPPRISAISKSGRRLYQLARSGVEIPLEPRTVKVYSLRLLGTGAKYLDLEVHCSKGYYVRALARDLGTAMKCPAHLGSLRRVQSGAYAIERAVSWPLTVPVELISTFDAASMAIRTLELTASGVQKARHGQRLGPDDFEQHPSGSESNDIMAFTHRKELVALGRFCDKVSLCVTRGFACMR